MDLAYYISEILGLQGKVNVPGLGQFVKVRVNGYYNDEEAKFYPPVNVLRFNQQTTEDETLANYIADKKKISHASSKYFTEKYISNLLKDAAMREAEIGTLGWISAEGSKLTFKQKESLNGDPSYFGLPAVQVYKIGKQPVTGGHIPDLSLTIAPEVAQPKTAAAQTEPYYEEEVDEKRGANIWVITLIVCIVLAAAGAGALYMYKPELFGKGVKEHKPLPIRIVKPNSVTARSADSTSAAKDSIDTVKKDSLATPAASTVKTPVETDKTAVKPAGATVVKTAPPVAPKADPFTPAKTAKDSSSSNMRYELLVGSYKTETKANEVILSFKKRGFSETHSFKHGRWNRISLATLYDKQEATEMKNKMVRLGKIKEDDITIQPYKIKQ